MTAIVLTGIYGAYWGYRFTGSRLGALAPLVVGFGALPVLVGIAALIWHYYAVTITHHVTRAARTGLAADTARIQLVPPEMGTNAFGEPFFTYGQAIFIRLHDSQ